MISGILSLEVSPIERSTTKNAQFKSSGNAKQREKSKISAIMDGMIHVSFLWICVRHLFVIKWYIHEK